MDVCASERVRIALSRSHNALLEQTGSGNAGCFKQLELTMMQTRNCYPYFPSGY
ncbi:MAG: hypothetical protein ACLVAW_26555 [Eisenbergiella massiliensis]